jgi:methylmalonyl-CoA mutase N-terminal domain/subunit
MKERFGAKDERSMKLRFHTQTAGAALTAQQPQNNVARVTLQALAAVLGGTQSLHTNSFDEALALPSEDSARIALRTQQIIAYESGATDTADPLAGSYYVEALTDEIEKAAAAYIEKIDALGGATAAIEQGYIQREIADSAYAFQKAVESGDQIVVGLNKFQMEEAPPSGLLRVDPAVADRQAEKLRTLRAKRDGAAAEAALLRIREAAETDENLMVPILACARLYCTEGEIADTLRQVFGEYRPAEIL